MFRKFSLLALLLILCIGSAAFAQEATPAFCGDLSSDDCAILQKSQDAMQTLDSVSFDLSVNATATNVPDMTGPVTFSLTGNGSFAGLNALHSGMTSAAATPDYGQAITNVLDNLDGDLTLTLNLPPEATQADPSVPSTITLQIRLVDGVGYLNTDTLKPLMGDSSSTAQFQGWYGIDLANMIKAMLQQMPDMFNSMQMMQQGANPMAYAQQFSNPETLKQFVTITRTDNGSGDTATFETTVDLGALMNTPEFQDMMRQQMESQGESMTEEEMQQGMAMSQQMMQGMTVTVDEEIGISDGFVRSIHGTFAFDGSAMMSALQEMVTPEAGAPEATPETIPNFNVDFTLNYSSFNSAPTISAPEGATVIPYQSILGMMSSEMGSIASQMTSEAPMGPSATTEPSSSG